ncbi:MAG: AmmeMemoRadiSam system protein B [Magnetococcales bacterium]|nr:AmmeMemoRadiSam system protein B [Magnetococcales bacterium]
MVWISWKETAVNMDPATARKVRKPVLAGSWYPASAESLRNLVSGLLEEKTSHPEIGPQPLRALVVPHAGLAYSGGVAAGGFALLRDHPPRRVVILSPSHRVGFSGLSLPEATHFATPLGEIPLDLTALDTLRRQPLFANAPQAHDTEHAIEIELPLLQVALPDSWQLVPVIVGRTTPDTAARAADALRPLLDQETLLVISGDFTHYGAAYGYQPWPANEQLPERLREMDMTTFGFLQRHDTKGFLDHLEKTGNTSCAAAPAGILLNLLDAECRVTLLEYDTSGRMTRDNTLSVSYLAIAVTREAPLSTQPDHDTDTLGEADMRLLHRLARRVLQQVVTSGSTPANVREIARGFEVPDHLRRLSGAFVTLKKHHDLRGCIGSILPVMPLWDAVADNALNAALRDPRFRPVQPEELPQLEVEVSVLSPLRPIPGPEAFVVGKQGILLTKEGRRAVFLPEVATEQGWSREETLAQLSRKAGLAADAWRSGATFEVFTTRKYSAPFLEQEN